MNDIKYYKLIKDYPNHSIGDLVIYNQDIDQLNFIWHKDLKKIPTDFRPDMNPNWFELCLFVTEDNVPIFTGNEYFYIDINDICQTNAYSPRKIYLEDNVSKHFSTKESAEKYLKGLKHVGITFSKFIGLYNVSITRVTPDFFNNVEHIGNDILYGDVFKCWNDDNVNEFSLYFGTKS